MTEDSIHAFVEKHMGYLSEDVRDQFQKGTYGFFLTVDAFPFSGVAYLSKNDNGKPDFSMRLVFGPLDERQVDVNIPMFCINRDDPARGMLKEARLRIGECVSKEVDSFSGRRQREWASRGYHSLRVSFLEPNGFQYLTRELQAFIHDHSKGIPPTLMMAMHIGSVPTETQESDF